MTDWRALEVADNAEVGCIPGDRVMEAARSLDLTGVDVLVLSACVQMPSLDLVQAAEDEFGIPVLIGCHRGRLPDPALRWDCRAWTSRTPDRSCAPTSPRPSD